MSRTLVSPVLVGRTAEVARLDEALRRILAGEPAVVLIAGEAGVGKTRIVEELTKRVRGVGAQALIGGCVDLGGESAPLAPLLDALRTLVRTWSADDLARLLGPARRELSRLLPELDPTADVLASPETTSRATAQLWELVLGVLTRLAAEAPLVFVVEDMHWADRSTLDLMAFLASSLRGVPVLLVMTYRSDELSRSHPLRLLLSTWERMRSVDRIELARFGEQEVAEQLNAILGAPPDHAMTQVVFDRSEGNAFLVEEIFGMVRDGLDPHALPQSLRDLLLARVDVLSPLAQQLLRVASVAGHRVPEPLLARVSGMPKEDLYTALREAVEYAQLVVDDSGDGYRFRHALAREAVYGEMLPGERVELHTAYGEALEADPQLGGDDITRTAMLAQHWYAAHDLPRALSAAAEAARAAAASYAPAEALRHFERALEVWRQVPDAEERAGGDYLDVVSEAARAAFCMADLDRTRSLLREAVTLAEAAGEEQRTALLLEQQAMALRAQGNEPETRAVLESAAARLPADPPTRARAAVLAALASSQLWLGDPCCGETAREAVEVAAACGARAQQAHALISLGSSLGLKGKEQDSLGPLQDGLALAEQLGDYESALRGYVNLSDSLETFGRHAESIDVATRGALLAERIGFARTFGTYLASNAAEAWLQLGRWAEAEGLIFEAQRTEPTGIFASALEDLLGEIALERGDDEAALQHVRNARRFLLQTENNPQSSLPWAAIEATVALRRGNPATARQIVADALAPSNSWSFRYVWPLVWLGQRAEADQAVAARTAQRNIPEDVFTAEARLVEVADNSPAASPVAVAYRSMAEAERHRLSATDAAVAAWSAAVTAWRATSNPLRLGYALFRLAEALVMQDRDLAREAAAEASEIGARLGAAPLLADVDHLVRRARLILPKSRLGGDVEQAPDRRLTDRELGVLELVAEGRSNSQIASALFISPKTVSVHVSNILAKLGVASRIEAAMVARSSGLLPSDS